jgi:GNAT superfamily N-acetyltransferase
MGLDDETDTLGRWTSHYVASLIEEASVTRSSSVRSEAQRDALNIILALWERRAALPGNIYPLKQYKYLLRILAATSPDATIWGYSNKSNISDLVSNVYRNVLGVANIALALDSRPSLFEQKRKPAPDIYITFINEFEKKMLGAVESLDEHSLALLEEHTTPKSTSTKPRANTLNKLLKAIGQSQDNLKKLSEHVSEELFSIQESIPKETKSSEHEWSVSLVTKVLSETEMKDCVTLLKDGEAVDVAAAKRGITAAKKLMIAREHGSIIGLAAIKKARPAYAAKIARDSSAIIEVGADEMGYIAVSPKYRRLGVGRELVSALLDGVKAPLFATTASIGMKRILEHQGFAKSGRTWSGRAGRLSLWQRSGTKRRSVVASRPS